MGYSLFVKCKNQKAAKDAMDFLTNNWTYISTELFTTDIEPTTEPVYRLKYKTNIVGFDYPSYINPDEYYYLICICAFIAKRYGHKLSCNSNRKKLKESYLIHDGEEKFILSKYNHIGYKEFSNFATTILWTHGQRYSRKIKQVLTCLEGKE